MLEFFECDFSVVVGVEFLEAGFGGGGVGVGGGVEEFFGVEGAVFVLVAGIEAGVGVGGGVGFCFGFGF